MLASSLGLAFAECARRALALSDQRVARELFAVLSFAVMLVLPISIYLYLAYTDWYWLFLVESKRVPTGVGLLLVLLPGGAMVGSFLGAGALLRLNRKKLLRYLELGHAVLLFTGAIVLRHRLVYNGSTLSFQAGVMVQGRLGWALVVIALGLLAGAALVGHAILDEARRLRPSMAGKGDLPAGNVAPNRRREAAAAARRAEPAPRGNS